MSLVGMRSGSRQLCACMSTATYTLRDQLPFYMGFVPTVYLHLRVIVLLLNMLCRITSRQLQLDQSTMLFEGGKLLHLHCALRLGHLGGEQKLHGITDRPLSAILS